MKRDIDFKSIVPKFDEILKRGLRSGAGESAGEIGCIENAVCEAMGLPYSDAPDCVTESIAVFKRGLNDCGWSSNEARAAGLRDLGIAQIGSKGVITDMAFSTLLAERMIRHFIPALFRDVFKDEPHCLAAADECERVGSRDAASAASYAASCAARDAASAASYAARDASYAARAASYAARDASYAARAASYAARAASYAARDASDAARAASYAARDKYLLLSASIALQVLRDLKSPGCEWLAQESK
jgi:hypothetical protein